MADLIEWVKVENPEPPAIEAYKVYLNYEDEKYFFAEVEALRVDESYYFWNEGLTLPAAWALKTCVAQENNEPFEVCKKRLEGRVLLNLWKLIKELRAHEGRYRVAPRFQHQRG